MQNFAAFDDAVTAGSPSPMGVPYPVSTIPNVVKAIYGSSDDICPQALNNSLFASITSYSSITNTSTHLGLLNTNTDAYLAEIVSQLAAAPEALGDAGICPVEEALDECTKSSCSDKEARGVSPGKVKKLNSRLERSMVFYERFMTKGKGSIEKMQKMINMVEAEAIKRSLDLVTDLPLFSEC